MSDRPLNVIADLMELKSRLNENPKNHVLELAVELRIARVDVEEGVISARRAFVQLELDGFEIPPGARLGEPSKLGSTTEVKTVSQTTSNTTLKGSVKAEISPTEIMKLAAGGEASGSRETHTKREERSKEKIEKRFITARPGDRWEVSGEPEGFLNATYLLPDTPLCHVDKIDGANRNSLTVKGYVLRKDLDYKPDRKRPFLSQNASQIVKAFIAKRISSVTGDIGEKLTICRQEIGDE